MAVATTAIIGAAIGVVQGLSENMARNSEYQRALANYGIDMAVIDAQAAMDQNAIAGEAAALQSNTQRYGLQIEQNAQADQAAAEVSAAASGTSGNAVDVTATQIAHSAGTAQGNLSRQEQQQLNQINQTSRDINITAESSKGPPPQIDARGGLLNIFNQGLQGFLFGR